jgi:DNA-binding NarL/FixJ family response regulator
MKLILTNQNGSGQIGPILSGDLDFNYNMSVLNDNRITTDRRYLNLFLFTPEKMHEILKSGNKNDFEIFIRIINMSTYEDLVPESAVTAISKLTKREIEMLEYLSMGLSQEQIADKLCITVYTVKSHFGNIYDTIGVHNYLCALLAYYKHLSREN